MCVTSRGFLGTLAVVLMVCVQRNGLTKALINDPCDPRNTTHDQCQIVHAYCQQAHSADQGLCTCRKGFVASRYERYCHPVVGVPCVGDVDCLVANAVCGSAGRCVCAKMHVASPDKMTCVPPLGRGCTDKCNVANASCLDRICSCNDQFVASPSKTECLPVLGQYCKMDVECTVKHSSCSNGLCACPRQKYVAASNKTACLPLVSRVLDEPCTQDTQCTAGPLGLNTMCVDHKCVCRYGNTVANQDCKPMKELDDWCTHSQECQMIAHASCVQKQCACHPYYVELPGNRSHCAPIALLYGASCTDNVQCTAGFGNGGVCRDGVCVCLNDYHFVVNYTGRCLPNRELGETCAHSSQCYLIQDGAEQHVACEDHLCTCQAGHVASVDKTTCSDGVKLLTTASLLVFTLLLTLTSELSQQVT